MVLIKEYRVCMPLTVEEYKIGQLYMIARHSLEQSDEGEGVEVMDNKPCEDPVHGKGQYTEKRIHLSNRLPYWIQAICPRVFYVTEKSWNYYPYTLTGKRIRRTYFCSACRLFISLTFYSLVPYGRHLTFSLKVLYSRNCFG
ncbi:cytoplasmic phosphatidylinositol transfer protein 1-like [Drosophila navojoa]|uniref:cytoplasmic phosphatidylinositol transfer protein 1-like n=1 Tax=Drosophila navojoa TaxID=7232 RepID=UPI0011BFA819|nr:cytoplasmic phosphatidylinositol transfer protein 1-like [Drosophila navojoa]